MLNDKEIELIQIRNKLKQYKKVPKGQDSVMWDLFVVRPLKKKAKKLENKIRRSNYR